jgi:uncharacterized OB-fold protein
MSVDECRHCGRRSFYRKSYCPNCGHEEVSTLDPGDGELLATTTVTVTPNGVREPNRLGIAKFAGGANMIAQLGDESLSVGDSVRLEEDCVLREGEKGQVRGAQFVEAN